MAPCPACQDEPRHRCARCGAGLCDAHQPPRGQRCATCEAEWAEERRGRRALQGALSAPAFVLAGGAAFTLLLPMLLAMPFVAGAVVISAVAVSVGAGAARGAWRMVDQAARARFLREHARTLPEARALRPGGLLPPAPR